MKRVFLLAISMLLCCFLPVSAAQSDPPLPEGEKGTITVHLYYGTDGVREELDGVILHAVQVAVLHVENGQAEYESVAPFSQIKADYSKIQAFKPEDGTDYRTSKEYKEALEQFTRISEEEEVDLVEAVTDTDGLAVFSGLRPGIYLIQQAESSSLGETYSDREPFLVSVPELDGAVWSFQVNAEPKVAVTRTPPTPSRPSKAKTAVDSNMSGYQIMGFAALCAFAVLWRQKRHIN